MHLLKAFSIAENSNSEGFHNIIVNVFDVILEYALILPLYALSQLKPNLLIKVDALFFIPIIDLLRG